VVTNYSCVASVVFLYLPVFWIQPTFRFVSVQPASLSIILILRSRENRTYARREIEADSPQIYRKTKDAKKQGEPPVTERAKLI